MNPKHQRTNYLTLDLLLGLVTEPSPGVLPSFNSVDSRKYKVDRQGFQTNKRAARPPEVGFVLASLTCLAPGLSFPSLYRFRLKKLLLKLQTCISRLDCWIPLLLEKVLCFSYEQYVFLLEKKLGRTSLLDTLSTTTWNTYSLLFFEVLLHSLSYLLSQPQNNNQYSSTLC